MISKSHKLYDIMGREGKTGHLEPGIYFLTQKVQAVQ
jgi:hypothetical protein